MNRPHHWYCRSAHWQSTVDRLVPWAFAGVSLGEHVLELGCGPGLMTRRLASRTARVTAIDNDPAAIHALRRGLVDGIGVVRGDATRLPFATATFSAVAAFTMLHHISTAAWQSQLFEEAFRTLRPGGVFVGVDPRPSLALWLFHLGDTYTPLTLQDVGPRLALAGFQNISIDVRSGYWRIHAHSPA